MIVLESVRTAWQSILAASVYELAFGKLVNAVVTRLINEVLAFDDISVEEGEKVMLLRDLGQFNFHLYMDLKLLLLSVELSSCICRLG